MIDFHAHVVEPEVRAFSQGHVVNTAIPDLTGVSKRDVTAWNNWRQMINRKMVDPTVRLQDMDEMGVDIQVLTPSLVHQYTY